MKTAAIVVALAGICPAFGQTAFTVASNGNDHLYKIDLATGVATDVGQLTFGDAEGVSFGPGGKIFAIGGTIEEFWDITTPPGSLVGGTGVQNGSDAGLDFYNGTMYNVSGAGGPSTELYKIDTNTGAATLIGASAYFADNIAIDPTTGIAYGIDAIFADSVYKIDLNTGGNSLIGPLNIGNVSLQGATGFTPDGTLYFLTSDGNMYKIDKATGAASFLYTVTIDTGGTLSGCEGLAIDSSGGGGGCVTINFEFFPGPDGKLGTGDDIPIVAPTLFSAQATQLTNEFASVGVLFTPSPSINDQNEVLDAASFSTPASHTPPNILASSGALPISMSFPSPASKVTALIGISGGSDIMTAFNSGGGVIASVIGDDVEVTIDAGSAIIASVTITPNASTTPAIDNLEVCFGGAAPCYADCDMSGSLDFFDFLCFQNEFAAGTAYADCDGSGSLDFFDFLCFQNEFAAGCP